MAVIGTFGSYTAARLAIYSSQVAMNVTGNNIGNINTTGYTRQRADHSSMYESGVPKYANSYNVNIGYGAIVEQVSQIRDPFLDIRYRNENASHGYYDAMLNGFEQISHILDEVGRGTDDSGIIEAQLGDLKNSLSYLLEHPNSTTHDDLVRGSASTLCTLLNTYAKELEQVRVSEEERLMESTDDINAILNDIRNLNEQIRNQDIYGNNALELRDKRNNQIDKLSKYMNIDVTYSMEQLNATTQVEKLTISLKNTKDYNWNQQRDSQKPITLIDGIYATQLDFGPDENDPDAILDEKGNPTGEYYFYDIGTDWGEKEPRPVTQAEYDELQKAGNTDELAKVKVADKITLKFGETLAINPDYHPILNKDVGKYLDINGAPTNDMTKASIVHSYQKDADDNRYTYRLSELKDKNGKVMNEDAPRLKSHPVWLDDNDMFGSLQALRELLTEEGEYSGKLDVALDSNASKNHGIKYYQHMLDSFAQKLAAQMNTANTMPVVDDYAKVYEIVPGTTGDGTTFADKNSADPKKPTAIKNTFTQITAEIADGTTITIAGGNRDLTLKDLKDLKQIITAGQDPNTPFPQIKTKTEDGREVLDYSEFEAYQAALKDYQTCLNTLRDNGTLTEEYAFYDGGTLFSNNGEGDDPSNITAKNISVSHSWSHGQNRVLNTVKGNTSFINSEGKTEYSDGTTRNDNIAHIISLMNQGMKYMAKDTVGDAIYNGTEFFSGNFQDMYGNTTSTLGTETRTVSTLYSNYTLTTTNLDNDRISVYGVDLNEEATNMMQFSQSFSAACKLLTTIDDMLDTLINRTI